METVREESAFSALIHEIFRLNGVLHAAEDRLTGDLGLTSARWHVLHAIDGHARTVAQIARTIGLSRQAVQRLANVLVEEGFAQFADNPDHKRAKLMRLTDPGRDALHKANHRHADWSRRLAAGFEAMPIDTTLWMLRNMRRRLTASERLRSEGAGSGD